MYEIKIHVKSNDLSILSILKISLYNFSTLFYNIFKTASRKFQHVCNCGHR